MDQQLIQLQEVFWIFIPVLLIYISLLIIGLWDWYKKKELLRQNKLIWLLIILLFSIIGPIVYLVANHQLTLEEKNKSKYDDWRD